MAHGSPSIELCLKCSRYALIPRFSDKICPKCKKGTNTISRLELKKLLKIPIYKDVYVGFSWKKLPKKDEG